MSQEKTKFRPSTSSLIRQRRRKCLRPNTLRIRFYSRLPYNSLICLGKRVTKSCVEFLILPLHWRLSNSPCLGYCSITYRITRHGCSIFYHWGRRQLKSQQNEGICGSTERSEVLLEVLSVMLTLQLTPEAVNKSGCKAGFEVGIWLCSPIPTITKLYGSVLASILSPPNFVIVI